MWVCAWEGGTCTPGQPSTRATPQERKKGRSKGARVRAHLPHQRVLLGVVFGLASGDAAWGAWVGGWVGGVSGGAEKGRGQARVSVAARRPRRPRTSPLPPAPPSTPTLPPTHSHPHSLALGRGGLLGHRHGHNHVGGKELGREGALDLAGSAQLVGGWGGVCVCGGGGGGARGEAAPRTATHTTLPPRTLTPTHTLVPGSPSHTNPHPHATCTRAGACVSLSP